MTRAPRPLHRRRTGLALTAGAVAALLLGGCGSSAAEPAAASSAAVAPAAATGAAAPADLSAGLLPESAFGSGAQVRQVTPDQLRSRSAPAGLVAALRSATVTPDSCATLLRGLAAQQAPTAADVTGFAAQTARGGSATTAEALVAGPLTDGALEQLDAAVDACGTAAVSTPMGSGTVTVTRLDAPALGDASTAVRLEVSLAGSAGGPRTMTGLAGVVADGDRLVTLVSGAVAGVPEQPDFLALLRTAYERQAAALD